MQPTPPTPPPPPDLPPTPPEPPTQIGPITVDVEGLRISEASLPRTAEQVRGLKARQESIREQLESAREQRGELTEQMQSAGSEARPGLERQLQVIDERIVQLEQDLTATGRLINAAPPELMAKSVEQQHAMEMRRADNDEEEMFLVGGGLGMLLALTAVAVRRRFRRRSEARRPGGTAVTADDPRIDRLGQAVDAIALEVERIGEGQRFVTQLLAEERDPRRLVGARPEDAIGQQRR